MDIAAGITADDIQYRGSIQREFDIFIRAVSGQQLFIQAARNKSNTFNFHNIFICQN